MDELNRDLLVAVLAVLTDAIPRSGLVAALKTWSQNRDQPLAPLLKEAAGLDDERLLALECLAAAHLMTHQGDLRISLDALNAQDLTHDVMTEIDDDDLRTTLNTTLGCESTLTVDRGSSGVLPSPGSSQASRSAKDDRFQLIRPHARGGIGQVWLARDSELQREVAVKEIQPKYAEREDQRARFVLEAEITGSLEHPGIVPVYSLGRNAAGRPYYAMRFIRGESLSVAIRRFHKKLRDEGPAAGTKVRGQSKWGIEFRQLIGRFLDVCDAMDYAHSRGVLHRDLKPANIMLGDYGETLVVDWGLAKVILKSGIAQAPPDAAIAPDPAGDSDQSSGETEQGTTIGTPAYMSPEQARGSIDQLGPASDVYSLGASLYELLTGQVAFHEETISAVIQKVLASDFPPPRAVDRSIPAPLEAICLKAMAKEPEARYPSVRTLAQDLEHWLADEPIAAYPERRLEKLARWFRQHRTWTIAAALALVGIAMVAIIAAVSIEGARRREAVVREEAETNFDMAQKAVEDYLTNVSENTLLKEQDTVDIRGLRQDLLKSALAYYQRFVAQRKNDPLLRQQLAKAYFRVGQITKDIGSLELAIDAFRSARSIWEPLALAHPDEHELQGYLAQCYLAIGKLETADNNLSRALNTLNQSRAILERLAAGNPSEAGYQSSLADCYVEIGIVHARLEEPDQSLAIHEKAKAIQERLIDAHPDNLAYRQSLAENINAIGYAYFKRHDNGSALMAFQHVQDICQAIMKEVTPGPKPVWLLNLLALSQNNIGSIHRENGELAQALQSLEQSLGSRSALADSHPSVTQFQVKLGISYREIADVQREAHEEPKAFRSIQRSIDVFEGLVRSHPEQASYHSQLGLSWNGLGILYDEARKNADAIRPFQQAVIEQQLAVEKSKDADGYTEYLCNHIENLGEQYVDLGRVIEAVPQYLRALQLRRQLSAAHPENREHALEVVKALITLGNLRRHDGAPVAAAQSFTEARTLVERWLRVTPGDAALQDQLAAVLDKEANALADQDQPEKARPLLERAVVLLRRGANRAASAAEIIQRREWHSEALWDLARVLRTLKLPAEAIRVEAERIDLWKGHPPQELVALALKQTSRATQIGYGKTVISSQAKAVRNLDLDQAAGEVQLAVARGFKDLRMLKSHPESATLLARDDLKPLIKGLESSDQPPGPTPRK